MCGVTPGGAALDGVDLTGQAVIQGTVTRDEQPVAAAYVRLLDGGGNFTAEVPTSATGGFRFFAAPGEWTLRTLAPKAQPVERKVLASLAAVVEVRIAL